jgi:hypothetical protein
MFEFKNCYFVCLFCFQGIIQIMIVQEIRILIFSNPLQTLS